MTDATDKKKKTRKSAPRTDAAPKEKAQETVKNETAAEQPGETREKTGAMLRRVREEHGYTVDDVARGINIRAAQIRAIEEGRIKDLPGATYAVGFVRSYANFLKLDGPAVGEQFREEHGGVRRDALKFPEPIAEEKLPSPTIFGLAAVGALLVFTAWSVFSTSDVGLNLTDTILPAPDASASAAPAAVEDAAAPVTVEEAVPAEDIAATPAETETDAAAPAAAETVAVAAPPATEEAPAAEPPADATAAEAEAPAPPAANIDPATGEERPITIAPPARGRVTLVANQQTWVQVSEGSKVVYKKLMAKGERFSVPDKKNMTLVTSNAGGLDVLVDGKKVQAVGGVGEIVRGVSLAPDDLSRKRVRVRRQHY